MRTAKILLVIASFFIISIVVLKYPAKKIIDYEKLMDTMKESVERDRGALLRARFACPRYLLMWSMALYQAGMREEAIKLAEAVKTLSSIERMNTNLYKTEYKPKYKTDYHGEYSSDFDLKYTAFEDNMVIYSETITSIAESYLSFFNTGNYNDLRMAELSLEGISQYDEQIEDILKEPIAKGNNAINIAKFLASRWLLTLSQSLYLGRRSLERKGSLMEKKEIVCYDCAELAKVAKTVSEVYEKDAQNIKDLGFQEKVLAYAKALIKSSDAFLKFYSTSYEEIADVPYKYQEEVLSRYKDLENYVASQKRARR